MNYNEADILLVEDNMDDAEMTIRALKKVNLANKLLHLEDGQEALDYLLGSAEYAGRDLTLQPKLVLLDIKMPKVDGIEVLRKLKAHDETRMIPIVIMTSSAEERDLINSYRLGVNSYVVKPLNFEEFANAVTELGLYWLLTNQLPQSKEVKSTLYE